MDRKASARWNGDLKSGNGAFRTGSGTVEGKYSFSTRFEDAAGTNPEELLGAAHASCFSMALSLAITKAGHSATSIETDAVVHLQKVGEAMTITGIDLTTRGTVPGIEGAEFDRLAQETVKGCIVSRALSAVPMTVAASLTA
jgi:osmotically inducible protein OsmC